MVTDIAAADSLQEGDEVLRLARHAVQTRKLSITWEEERPTALSEAYVLRAVWLWLRRWHPAVPEVSQDERVWLKLIDSDQQGCWVRIRAVFDRDFCSQYDQSEIFEEESFWEYPTAEF